MTNKVFRTLKAFIDMPNGNFYRFQGVLNMGIMFAAALVCAANGLYTGAKSIVHAFQGVSQTTQHADFMTMFASGALMVACVGAGAGLYVMGQAFGRLSDHTDTWFGRAPKGP